MEGIIEMTFRNGFIIGAIAGVIAWGVSARWITWSGESASLPSDIFIFTQIIFLISAVLAFAAPFARKAILGTTFGGVIAGYVAGFELPTIVYYLNQGQLPPI